MTASNNANAARRWEADGWGGAGSVGPVGTAGVGAVGNVRSPEHPALASSLHTRQRAEGIET